MPDAKVRGKLVRITCKHCAAAIVVDGRQMSPDAEAAPQPLPSYSLPPAAAPAAPAAPPRPPSPAVAPAAAAVTPAALRAGMPDSLREEDETMIVRSKFREDVSVHEEQTVIGQIPREALEFERMFAQRTQPPPADEPKASADTSSSNPPLPAMPTPRPLLTNTPVVPAGEPAVIISDRPVALPEVPERVIDSTKNASPQAFGRSNPPAAGARPVRDERTMISSAETTEPSVAKAVTARRLRVALVALLLLAVLLVVFVIRTPR